MGPFQPLNQAFWVPLSTMLRPFPATPKSLILILWMPSYP